MLLLGSITFVSFAACAIGLSFPPKLQDRQDQELSHKCGEIIDEVNAGYQVFSAAHAHECLTSVPFYPAVAKRFIKYWNETVQFQSTLAYLKNPPVGYQQPAVDIVGELQRIQDQIEAGSYTNQYDFEVDVQQNVVYSMNDGHVSLSAGILSAFSFASPVEIVSVSVDGKQAPKVFIADDLIQDSDGSWAPSAITTINGTETNVFLTRYAALNSWGYLESHAEWNSLMSHPTLDIQGGLTSFSGGGTFYPGDVLTFTFENNTQPLETSWVAIYSELANHTGPLATGGDFYNYFVLGLLPESFDPSLIIPPAFSDEAVAPTTNWSIDSYGAFPSDPVIAQADLGVMNGGVVTGYFLEDISTGVLSLPTFDIQPDTTDEFNDAVLDFINNASAQGLQRIVIDVQHNSGGVTLLAYTIFKTFFPELIPYGGSRRRIHPLAHAIGSSISEYWSKLDDDGEKKLLKEELAADEWVVLPRLNAATGRTFTDWAEYEGPVNDNNDTFSLTERYDLANEIFDEAAFDKWVPLMYLRNATQSQRRWNPDQIVILTDGLCGSTCALLVEFLTRAGVRTVVAGGRPEPGPMQAASGNRGAASYAAVILDKDMSYAREVDTYVALAANASIPDVRDPGMNYRFASFNLRDQVRPNETVPLQFKYEAADCRIYYTMANIYNMTRLWHDVSAAAFVDASLCVEGSTGFSTTNNTNPLPPPIPNAQRPNLGLNLNESAVRQREWDNDPADGLRDAKSRPLGNNVILPCPNNSPCQDLTTHCKEIEIDCSGENPRKVFACLPLCSNWEGPSTCPGSCQPLQTQDSKTGLGSKAQYREKLRTGLCYPKTGTRELGCKRDPVHPKL